MFGFGDPLISSTEELCLVVCRYCAPHRVSDTVTIQPTVGRSFQDLLGVFKAFFRPKCHPIMLDGCINGVHAVTINVLRIACLAVAKLLVAAQKPQFAQVCLQLFNFHCLHITIGVPCCARQPPQDRGASVPT